jgi:hypothetical protein
VALRKLLSRSGPLEVSCPGQDLKKAVKRFAHPLQTASTLSQGSRQYSEDILVRFGNSTAARSFSVLSIIKSCCSFVFQLDIKTSSEYDSKAVQIAK